MARKSKSGYSISFWGDQCKARTKMVCPITLKWKKLKKKATKYPRFPTMTKELSEESQSLLVIHALAEKQPLLVVHHLLIVRPTS